MYDWDPSQISSSTNLTPVKVCKFLCGIAWADADVTDEEKRYILNLAVLLGLREDQFKLVEGWLTMPPDPHDVKPSSLTDQDRVNLIQQALIVFGEDGQVCRDEERLIETLARSLHISTEEVETIRGKVNHLLTGLPPSVVEESPSAAPQFDLPRLSIDPPEEPSLDAPLDEIPPKPPKPNRPRWVFSEEPFSEDESFDDDSLHEETSEASIDEDVVALENAIENNAQDPEPSETTPESDSETEAKTEPNAAPETDAHPAIESDDNTELDIDAEPSEPEAESDTDDQPDPNIETESKAEPNTNEEPKAEVDTATDEASDPESEPEAQTETASDIGTEPAPDADQEPEPDQDDADQEPEPSANTADQPDESEPDPTSENDHNPDPKVEESEPNGSKEPSSDP